MANLLESVFRLSYPKATAEEMDDHITRRKHYAQWEDYYNNHWELPGAQPGELNPYANYPHKIVDNWTSQLFGQTNANELCVGWTVDLPVDYRDVAAQVDLSITRHWKQTRQNTVLRDAAHYGSKLGDTILKVGYDAVWQRPTVVTLDPYAYYPRPDSDAPDKLVEVVEAYWITRDDALRKYNTTGDPNLLGERDYALKREHWTTDTVTIYIDDEAVDSKPNPLSPDIPYVHIPNKPSGDYWGTSDINFLTELNGILNRMLADEATSTYYHAHPTVTIKGLSQEEVADLPTGPNVVWGLGDGEAALLEWRGTPPSVHEFSGFILAILQDLAGMPDISFGRDRRSIQSGLALQIKMYPVSVIIRDKRLFWTDGLMRANELILKYIERMQPDIARDILTGGDKRRTPPVPLLSQIIVQPSWHGILPKDEAVQLQNAMMLYTSAMLSLPDALEMAGIDRVDEKVLSLFDWWRKIQNEFPEMADRLIPQIFSMGRISTSQSD